jgi:hypothetical protein
MDIKLFEWYKYLNDVKHLNDVFDLLYMNKFKIIYIWNYNFAIGTLIRAIINALIVKLNQKEDDKSNNFIWIKLIKTFEGRNAFALVGDCLERAFSDRLIIKYNQQIYASL